MIGIRRIDKYNIEVDGMRVRATPEQEQKLRSMPSEVRARFVLIMGGKAIKEEE